MSRQQRKKPAPEPQQHWDPGVARSGAAASVPPPRPDAATSPPAAVGFDLAAMLEASGNEQPERQLLPDEVDGLTFAISLWHEAIPGNGEDAAPLLEHFGTSVVGGVFDGMGGSGGTRYDLSGTERKGAYIGSRLARGVVSQSLSREIGASAVSDTWLDSHRGEQIARALERDLRATFGEAAAALPGAASKLKSDLVRVLPTTAAVLLLQPSAPSASERRAPSRRVAAIWAGDSRAYALSPTGGLVQLTLDDTRSPADAFESLTSDPPLANCISASDAFVLRSTVHELRGPSICFVATDGCFGYLSTPAHFENLMLESLAAAKDPEQWRSDLRRRIQAVTGDDASLAVLVAGCASFAELRKAFAARAKFVAKRYVARLSEWDAVVNTYEQKLANAKSQRAACAQWIWNDYRSGYERFLPDREESQ